MPAPFRVNWFAIIFSAIASFVFEAVWFTIFLKQWLAGIGRTREWLMSPAGYAPGLQYCTVLACSSIVAVVLTVLIQMTGPQTAWRGVKIGALIWLGFVATSWAKEYVFEVRTLQIYLINTIYTLIDLTLIGLIVGGWKPRQPKA